MSTTLELPVSLGATQILRMHTEVIPDAWDYQAGSPDRSRTLTSPYLFDTSDAAAKKSALASWLPIKQAPGPKAEE